MTSRTGLCITGRMLHSYCARKWSVEFDNVSFHGPWPSLVSVMMRLINQSVKQCIRKVFTYRSLYNHKWQIGILQWNMVNRTAGVTPDHPLTCVTNELSLRHTRPNSDGHGHDQFVRVLALWLAAVVDIKHRWVGRQYMISFRQPFTENARLVAFMGVLWRRGACKSLLRDWGRIQYQTSTTEKNSRERVYFECKNLLVVNLRKR